MLFYLVCCFYQSSYGFVVNSIVFCLEGEQYYQIIQIKQNQSPSHCLCLSQHSLSLKESVFYKCFS